MFNVSVNNKYNLFDILSEIHWKFIFCL